MFNHNILFRRYNQHWSVIWFQTMYRIQIILVKLKEHRLVDSFREYYEDIELVHDKRIDDGCSLRRPDLRIECFTHTIIIECD